MLTRRAHELLQEGIVWSGSLVALVSLYYLVIDNKPTQAPDSLRFRVSDAYAFKESTLVVLPPDRPGVPQANAGAGAPRESPMK